MLFRIATKVIERKTLVKHISCNCKCKLDTTTRNSSQKWSNRTCQCVCENYRMCKNDYSWSPGTCTCENGKYVKSTVDESAIMCN